MDKDEWVNAWNEGRTNFHRNGPHEFLVQYYDQVNLPENSNILVPMCGKSHDLIWLKEKGHNVFGVEIVNRPCQEFWSDHKLEFQERSIESAQVYEGDRITIINDDFFNFPRESIPEKIDFIFDRAALVALPEEMRKVHYSRIKELSSPGTKILLDSFEYDRQFETRAPYSVSDAEVKAAYSWVSDFQTLLTEVREMKGNHLSKRGIKEVLDYIYLMTV